MQNRHSYPSLILMGSPWRFLHACVWFILRMQEGNELLVKVSRDGGLGSGRTWLKLTKCPDHLSRLFHPDFALQTCRKLHESNFREKVRSHWHSPHSQPVKQWLRRPLSITCRVLFFFGEHVITPTFKDYCLNFTSAIVLCSSVSLVGTIWMLAQKPATQRYII